MIEQRSSLINIEEFRAQNATRKRGTEIRKEKEVEQPLREATNPNVLLNPKLYMPKSLAVDDYFNKIHEKIQEQFAQKTPMFSVEEMLAVPALEKMLCPQGRKSAGSAMLSDMENSEDEIVKLATMAPKCRADRVEGMLNFPHLYVDTTASELMDSIPFDES